MADVKTEKQKVQEITEKLEQGIKELFESEKYKIYLNTMSKFHNYSFNNTILITMQNPDATLVAGFKAWKKNFQRHVKKGEKGIRILAPAPYKLKEEQEKLDPETREIMLDEQGKPIMEEVEVTIPAFRAVSVFDVAQTEGKELPELEVKELSDSVEDYENFMQALTEVSPVPIEFEEIEGDAKGYFSQSTHRIAVQEGMSQSQTLKTAIHEVAHAKLHDREINQGIEDAEFKDRNTKEVEAESIAYTVCQHFGIETSDYSFSYIAGWSSGKEMTELKSSLDTIRRTASEIITGIEHELSKVQERVVEQEAELSIMQKAEKLIDCLESEKTIFSQDERNLIVNYAYKIGDMDKTTELAYRLAELEENSPNLVAQTVINAQAEIDALPDAMVGLSEMHEYGYTWAEMLPLTQERALELFDHDLPIYRLYEDGSEGSIDERSEIMEHSGMFGVEKGDWEQYVERQSMREELEENSTNTEAQLLYGRENQFGIYQLNDSPQARDVLFMNSDFLEMKGVAISRENYNLIYTAPLEEGTSLEDIFTRFNIDRPEDFKGHSLSVSDVVVLHQNGENSYHFVDSFGYKEVPEFIQEVQEEHDKVSYYVIEDLSTWAENSPNKSELEHFDSFTEALDKFKAYREKDAQFHDDKARTTLGFNVHGSEFDVIHARNNENVLSLDFTYSSEAKQSNRFMDDLQILCNELIDKVRVHRDMTPEEVKDFVKKRFEHHLHSTGIEDASMYMSRFDTLYEQGKMEHLMPTANQKHIVEDIPFEIWDNPYFSLNESEQMAFAVKDKFISIQTCTDGYDYSIYCADYSLFDGGVYDNPDVSIHVALRDIIEDFEVKRSDLVPVDYDELTEKAEAVEKARIEEKRIVSDFREKTKEMFHEINGQTPEDVEQTALAYIQSKIDEQELDAEVVDVILSGSRCRGLESDNSDIDIVVEYKGSEHEDTLFNVLNEDGFMIGGMKVDINPITEDKTGTPVTYLPGVENYLAEKKAVMEKEAHTEPVSEEKKTTVTLTVAECGEFHNMGEYHEGIASVDDALAIFHQIPPERMNGIPSIGINVHTEGTESYQDTTIDIVSGKVADLEVLDYVPDISDDPKAIEMITELIDKLPDIEVRGSLEKWQASILATQIDQFSYDYDTYQYRDTVEDREVQVANIMEDIRNGNTGYLNDFLNAVIAEGIRDGITDIFGQGVEPDDSEAVQTVRKAQELLDKLTAYKPLAKVEELEESNYNMIDNVLNNDASQNEEKREPGRISVKEKLAEKKSIIEQRDKDSKPMPEKDTEKKNQREI